MPKVTVNDGLRLHYQEAGDGPDLVMIHGLTGNLAVWHLRIVPLLWDHFRIITYDLRGHGYSDMPPTGYSADQMAADLLGLLDALEIERPSLVGHSFGADIGLYFAYLHPERVAEVIAVEAALPAMVHFRSRDEWEGWDHWCEALERSGHPVPAERRSDVNYLLRASLDLPKKWGPLAGLPRNPEPFLRLIDETTAATDYERIGSLRLDRIPDIGTPVLLMYTEDSAFLGTHDYLLAHLPNARSTLLPATEWGHFGPLEQPEAVADHVLAFLERHEPSPASGSE
jgi:pimeloyl-ACP methyl ester carboxylesterase